MFSSGKAILKKATEIALECSCGVLGLGRSFQRPFQSSRLSERSSTKSEGFPSRCKNTSRVPYGSVGASFQSPEEQPSPRRPLLPTRRSVHIPSAAGRPGGHAQAPAPAGALHSSQPTGSSRGETGSEPARRGCLPRCAALGGSPSVSGIRFCVWTVMTLLPGA